MSAHCHDFLPFWRYASHQPTLNPWLSASSCFFLLLILILFQFQLYVESKTQEEIFKDKSNLFLTQK